MLSNASSIRQSSFTSLDGSSRPSYNPYIWKDRKTAEDESREENEVSAHSSGNSHSDCDHIKKAGLRPVAQKMGEEPKFDELAETPRVHGYRW